MSSISEVIHAHVDKILNEIHTSFPAKILRYDHDRQVADLQPTIKKKFRDGTALDLPVLHDVPILFYAAKDCVIGLPVGEGDTVLVLISERSIDGWLHSDGDIVDPDDIRKFNLSDALAFPCLRARQKIEPFEKDSIEIRHGKNILRLCSLHIYISAEKPLNIKSSDEVTIEAAKSIEIKSEQTLNIQCKNANIKPEKITIDASISKFNGDVECKNVVCSSLKAETKISAGVDVTAAKETISLAKHVHGGVLSGGAATSIPTPTG